jgi:ACS family hexuronate transporter-like MFS transporter
MSEDAPVRSKHWKWGVCILLLAATTINYMDRLTLSTAASRIMQELKIDEEQYGRLELCFGMAFAAGGLVFGALADRINVRFLYPLILLLWSAVGFGTGLVHGYGGLLACRTLLGFFEAGHWPCGLKTVQHVLAAKDRTMGNSLLQGGASIGAIVTPQVMNLMLTPQEGSWRLPFMLLGVAGSLWIALWLGSIRTGDLAPPRGGGSTSAETAEKDPSLWAILLLPRFLSLMSMVVLISLCWQLFRAWLPLFLEKGRGYTLQDALHFTSAYYVAAELGVLAAGFLTLRFHKGGLSIHASRCRVFVGYALLTLLTTAVAFLPKGPLLLGMLLLVAFGALGLFPCYYSFTQELSVRNMGKVTGLLSFFAWAIPSPLQWLFGKYVKQTGSYDLGIALVGWAPLLSFVILVLLWNRGIQRRLA